MRGCIAHTGLKRQNFPVFSRKTGITEPETGSPMTASTASLRLCHWALPSWGNETVERRADMGLRSGSWVAYSRCTSAEKWSTANTMLCIVRLDARVVLDPLIMLDQLGRDAIGQVGRHMIEHAGLKVSDPYEHLEIRDC